MKRPNEVTDEFLVCIVQLPSKHWYDQSLGHVVNRIEHFLPIYALFAAGLFAVFSVIFYTIIATTRPSKIVLSDRRIVMMQPYSVLTCFSLVAYFACQVDAIFFVPQGVCLDRANGKTVCTAGDIRITSVTKTFGPVVCPEGKYVNVTINTTLDVTSTTRYDIGIYVGLGGENAQSAQEDNSCLVQSLSDDIVTDPPGIVGNLEGNTKNDACLDSNAGIIKGFLIEDFTVFCNYLDISTNVNVSVCLVWDNNKVDNCNRTCYNSTQNGCLGVGSGSVSASHSTLFF